MSEPIGLRQNNPGNIEIVKGVVWEGQAPAQPGDRFCRFVEPKWGIRAIARVLITYADARKARDGSKIDTVREIIERWAPPNENDTDAYAKHVASRLNVKPDDALSIKDPETMRGLVEAIILHENGQQPYTDAQIEAGMVLAGIEPERKPLGKTRTVQGGKAVGVGTVLAAAAEALEPMKEQIGWLAQFSDLAKWAALAVVVLGLIAILWARIDDRMKGLR